MHITKILYAGKQTDCEPEKVEATLLQCGTAKIKGYKCLRCNKSEGFVHTYQGEFIFFCGTDECLQLDKVNPDKEKCKRPSAAMVHKLPSRVANACLSHWIADNSIKQRIMNWIKNPKHFLVHIGCFGCGKTYLAASILNYLWDSGVDVMYTDIRRFYAHLQQKIGSGGNQFEAVKIFCQKNILIIDDIGASTNTEWQKEMLLDLIDHRYADELPTVITSNFNYKEMANAVGERTASRIFAKENILIQVWETDHRGRNFEE